MADPFLKNWDKNIARHLGRIEECLMRAEYYLDQAVIAMEVLKGRPAFETRAEAALESMQEKIKEARDEYLSKPKKE